MTTNCQDFKRKPQKVQSNMMGYKRISHCQGTGKSKESFTKTVVHCKKLKSAMVAAELVDVPVSDTGAIIQGWEEPVHGWLHLKPAMDRLLFKRSLTGESKESSEARTKERLYRSLKKNNVENRSLSYENMR